MKHLITIILFAIICLKGFSQKIDPREYAVISRKTFTDKGLNIIPPFFNHNMAFSADGDYLFLLDMDVDRDGDLIVYDVTKKKIFKSFKIKKPKISNLSSKIICDPNNTNRIAFSIGKDKLLVLKNWRVASVDILSNDNKDIAVELDIKSYNIEMAFSKNGNNLYCLEYESSTIKVADLNTGKITKKSLPNGKSFLKNRELRFLKDDELIISGKSKDNFVEIFNLESNQIVRKFDLKDDSKIFTPSIGTPHIIFCGFQSYTLNLLTGETNNICKTIHNAHFGDYSRIELSVLPNIGFFGHYRESKSATYTRGSELKSGLFFFDKFGKVVNGYFPTINSKIPFMTTTSYIQVSPNGKYIAFCHDDIYDDKNDCLIIATVE